MFPKRNSSPQWSMELDISCPVRLMGCQSYDMRHFPITVLDPWFSQNNNPSDIGPICMVCRILYAHSYVVFCFVVVIY